MSLLKTIFRVFKGSALYDSYTDAQRNSVDKICSIYLNSTHTESEEEIIALLEMKVSRRVLSASIPSNILRQLLSEEHIIPGELELVNILDDVKDDNIGMFLNTFVYYSRLNRIKDMHQIKYFPKEAEKYLNGAMLVRLHYLQDFKSK